MKRPDRRSSATRQGKAGTVGTVECRKVYEPDVEVKGDEKREGNVCEAIR